MVNNQRFVRALHVEGDRSGVGKSTESEQALGREEVPSQIVLTEEVIRPQLDTRMIGGRIECYRVTTSTNVVAMKLARAGAPEGTLVIAEEQTRGRGRLGKKWDSVAGKGLWFSIVLRPLLLVEDLGLISIMAGVAVAETIAGINASEVRVKWPNDVLIAGKKCCGILTELDTSDGNRPLAILGIGVDVLHTADDFPGALREKATSLRMALGRPVNRVHLLAGIVREIERLYTMLRAGDKAGILEPYRDMCGHLGQLIEVDEGQQKVRGTCEGIAPDGSLLVRTTGGVRRVIGGECRLEMEIRS